MTTKLQQSINERYEAIQTYINKMPLKVTCYKGNIWLDNNFNLRFLNGGHYNNFSHFTTEYQLDLLNKIPKFLEWARNYAEERKQKDQKSLEEFDKKALELGIIKPPTLVIPPRGNNKVLFAIWGFNTITFIILVYLPICPLMYYVTCAYLLSLILLYFLLFSLVFKPSQTR